MLSLSPEVGEVHGRPLDRRVQSGSPQESRMKSLTSASCC